ncbi:50S ribosomal protein L5 [Candidatus Woesearchaeota archaeon]|nr:50S ribosomal protein L5 [Candidatus Woesearchaeota archaeon]
MNLMRNIRIEKITLNIGAGKDQQVLEKGVSLLKVLTNQVPLKTKTNKRIPEWGLRPGLPIGCKVTLRGKKAVELLPRLLESKERKLTPRQITEDGSISFGIPEYIDIPGLKYLPAIGIIGLEVCITLERPGYRIKRRSLLQRKVPRSARITREEAVRFLKENFQVVVGEE